MTVRGEPEKVIRCHCEYCQRRTGSVFNVSCWYYDDQLVERTGTGTVFNKGPQNPGIDCIFCPRCPINRLLGVSVAGAIPGRRQALRHRRRELR